MDFVFRFGLEKAVEMALDFKYSGKKFPFIYDTRQLSAFLTINRKKLFDLVKNIDKHYSTYELKKKNGNTRIIHAPDKELTSVQHQIQRRFLIYFTPSAHAMAYVRKRTIADNAAPHVGTRYLLKLDITNFFGSIRFDQVYGAAFHTKYFPKQIGVMLTKLCCLNNVLPQGAPTSPILSNIVMRNFDYNMGRWCKARQIAYTRYCDDLTFSSDKPLFHVYEKVKSMLAPMGFELNQNKTLFLTNASRQSVTGLTVNQKVTVSKDYKRSLRQEIYYSLKFGLAGSILYARRIKFMNNGMPDEEKYLQHLIGKAHFVLQIEPENQWFRKKVKLLENIKWKRQFCSPDEIL